MQKLKVPRRILVLGVFTSVALGAPTTYICSGGSIPSGTYSQLSVVGFCAIDGGSNGSSCTI